MNLSTRVIGVIQARMSSIRLPGKVLRKVQGKPILNYLVERLRCCCQLDGLILATSLEASDDPLERFAESISLDCHRGPLENVALRVLDAAVAKEADALARICGDSPLIDHGQVDRLAAIFRKENSLDLVTNVQKRTFPKGQSIEIISVPTLRRLVAGKLSPTDREHVTQAIYTNPKRYKILNIANKEALGFMQLSIDTERDVQRFEEILSSLGEPHWKHSLAQLIAAANLFDSADT